MNQQQSQQIRASAGFVSAHFVMINPEMVWFFGLQETWVLQTFDYLLQGFERRHVPKKDEHYWLIRTQAQWHEKFFRCFSLRTLQRILKDLEDRGCILVRRPGLSEDQIQRSWYSLNYPRISELMEAFREEQQGLEEITENPMFSDPEDPLKNLQDDPHAELSQGCVKLADNNNRRVLKKEKAERELKLLPRSAGFTRTRENPAGQPSEKSRDIQDSDWEPAVPFQQSPEVFLSSRTDNPMTGDLPTLQEKLEQQVLAALPKDGQYIQTVRKADHRNPERTCLQSFVRYVIYERGKQSLQFISRPEGNPLNIYPGLITYFQKRWPEKSETGEIAPSLITDWTWWNFLNCLGCTHEIRSSDPEIKALQEVQTISLQRSLKANWKSVAEYCDWLLDQAHQGLLKVTVVTALADSTVSQYLTSCQLPIVQNKT